MNYTLMIPEGALTRAALALQKGPAWDDRSTISPHHLLPPGHPPSPQICFSPATSSQNQSIPFFHLITKMLSTITLLMAAAATVSAQDGVFNSGPLGPNNPPPTMGSAINQNSESRIISLNSIDVGFISRSTRRE